ncbi:DUF4190 domain-containing protein [Actinomadura craniellae]|uniref:DUF4190 domain-containing protein n=1 Tax=Actinomadura craniellae TaxID=2231787 RepID=A0A365H6N7_9ACTN|nr:DUF4190 domain-containing protein [Actinomadura craniellae]RAY14741.1 DUF4190 domain-containing protein [Actinomadura craniellae]
MAQPPYGPYDSDPYADPYAQHHHHYHPAPAPVPVPGPVYARPTNNMATIGLIMGLVGLLFCGLTSPLAIIFGHIAHSQIKRTGEEGGGMAIAAIITGWLVTAGWLLFWLFWFGLLAAIGLSAGTTSTSGY